MANHYVVFGGTYINKSYFKEDDNGQWEEVSYGECLMCGGRGFFCLTCSKCKAENAMLALVSVMIAQAFQNSKVFGFDIHKPSIETAIKEAKKKNLNNAQFKVADAENYSGKFDIITFFDCLHDMGDPLGASKYAFNHLYNSGTLILIEPFASDLPEDNFNTVGQMYYSFSTMGCIPTSKSQKKGLALGAQAGPKKLFKILEDAGFIKCKIIKKNSTNMVITAEK